MATPTSYLCGSAYILPLKSSVETVPLIPAAPCGVVSISIALFTFCPFIWKDVNCPMKEKNTNTKILLQNGACEC